MANERYVFIVEWFDLSCQSLKIFNLTFYY